LLTPEFLPSEHQTDGIALGPDWTELIEVELTPKRPVRYVGILRAFRHRLDDGASQVTYLCNPDAGRAFRSALEASAEGLSIRRRVQIHDVYDRQGHSTGDTLPDWLIPAGQRAAAQRAVVVAEVRHAT
jgi:hypothetical protein